VWLGSILSEQDAERASGTLRKLYGVGFTHCTLTGGIAIEAQIAGNGGVTTRRPLNDLDFLVESFDSIPRSICDGFLLRHVHPYAPPGKILLQAVDAGSRLRIDLFRTWGKEMERASEVELDGMTIRTISLADLAARKARLCWEMVEGRSIAPKHARDLLRMSELRPPQEFQEAWQEHRFRHQPESFVRAVEDVREMINSHPELLVPSVYSTNVEESCPRCHALPGLPLADAGAVLSLLGYC